MCVKYICREREKESEINCDENAWRIELINDGGSFNRVREVNILWCVGFIYIFFPFSMQCIFHWYVCERTVLYGVHFCPFIFILYFNFVLFIHWVCRSVCLALFLAFNLSFFFVRCCSMCVHLCMCQRKILTEQRNLSWNLFLRNIGNCDVNND